jgi:DNA-binding response OmpR family regulator
VGKVRSPTAKLTKDGRTLDRPLCEGKNIRVLSSSVPIPAPLAVLFVDADTAGAQLLANAICDRYATAVVGSAREGYEAMRYQTPTPIMCEARLPDINGADFLAYLRGHPTTRHILPMAISSARSLQDKVRAFQAGADDVLVKPVEPATFVAHLQYMMRFRQIASPGSFVVESAPPAC